MEKIIRINLKIRIITRNNGDPVTQIVFLTFFDHFSELFQFKAFFLDNQPR
jgi:hypothetical protein